MPQITAAMNGANAQRTAGVGRKNNDILGKDAFFQLLITQLRHQDPLSPMDDREFVAQMAQFSALEQMQNMTEQIYRQNAMAMLGTEVLINPGNGSPYVAGLVESVVMNKSGVQVSVNGQLYSAEWVEAVQLAYGGLNDGPALI